MSNEIKGAVNITTGEEVEDFVKFIDSRVMINADRHLKDGLDLTYVTASTFSVSAGKADDSSHSLLITNSSAITKDFSSAWQAGTGNGCFPSTVSRAVSSWFHVFAIYTASGTFDIAVDTASDCSNALTDTNISSGGYIYYRYIGDLFTLAGDNTQFRAFLQFDDLVLWDEPEDDLSMQVIGDGDEHTLEIAVPPDFQKRALLMVGMIADGTDVDVYVSNPDISNEIPGGVRSGGVTADYLKLQNFVFPDLNSEVRYRLGPDYANVQLEIGTIGYYHLFGEY